MTLRVTWRSNNRKVGPAIVTGRSPDTCPNECPFYDISKGKPGAACYASGRITWHAETKGVAERETLDAIAKRAPVGATLRHHDVGDIAGPRGRIDKPYVRLLRKLGRLRPDLRHIMYTHAWRRARADELALPWVVNASCETPADVAEALERGYQAVITVPSDTDPLIGAELEGRRVVLCPNQRDTRVTCLACGLCAKSDRVQAGRPVHRPIVAFAAHGAGKRLTVSAIDRARSSSSTPA